MTSTLITPETVTIRFCGVNHNLLKLNDTEFNSLYDRVLDSSIDFSVRVENMTASEFVEHKDWIQKDQAQNAYNIELLELEEKRRKAQVMGRK